MNGLALFGDPSIPQQTAGATGGRPPNSRPAGGYTGAPTQTQFLTTPVIPNVTTLVVSATRENRFIILTAPFVGFSIFVGGSGVSILNGLQLVPVIPYEITLPGNQSLYAVSNAPVRLKLSIQIAPAITGDIERRL